MVIMKIAVVGAGGFVGNLLIVELAKDLKNSVVAISLNPQNIRCKRRNVNRQGCDVLETNKMSAILNGCEQAYYLVHMMASGKKDFQILENEAVNSFCKAAKIAKVKKVIYLGGLGNDSKKLSRHLASRHKTGEILRNKFSNTIEFRASIIIGKGSVSAEIIKQLVEKFSFMIFPGWANTLTQPICDKDVINYLCEASKAKLKGHKIYEIGGPETLTYKNLMKRYADYRGAKLYIFVIKILPRWPAKYFIGFFVDKNFKNTSISMIDSLDNQVIVTNEYAHNDFANIKPSLIDAVLDSLL